MDPFMQVLDPGIEVRFIGLPCQPVDPRCGVSLQCEERRSQHRLIEMVKERGEPFLLALPRGLSYALQRLCHACPVLRPARALLTRVSLGLGPSLHRLRRLLPGFVRKLRRYYGQV